MVNENELEFKSNSIVFQKDTFNGFILHGSLLFYKIIKYILKNGFVERQEFTNKEMDFNVNKLIFMKLIINWLSVIFVTFMNIDKYLSIAG